MKAFDRVPLMFGILLLLSFRADAHDPSMAHHEWFNAQGLFACGGGVNSCGCKAQLLLSGLESWTRLALGPTYPLVRERCNANFCTFCGISLSRPFRAT